MTKTKTPVMKVHQPKALSMIKGNKDIAARAESYFTTAKREVYDSTILPVVKEIETFEEKIFDLSDMSIKTDKNADIHAISREQVSANIAQLINAKFALDMKKIELNQKLKYYEELFV